MLYPCLTPCLSLQYNPYLVETWAWLYLWPPLLGTEALILRQSFHL